MFKRTLVCEAILCTLTLSAAPANAVLVNAGQEEDKTIEAIIVTASKRAENIQQTPVTVQAMIGEDLKDQNIGNFDDLVRFMPNITLGGRGPGQSDVFIRGLAIQPISVMLSGAQGTMPNVAIYHEEQPISAPGRNLDIFITDLERIEVLPGPQGTLFGAGSQAGTVRYITAKPQMDGFTAGFGSSLADTRHGESSESIEGYVNWQVSDNFALRGALYHVDRGGYIDNVLGEFTLDPAINPNSSVSLADGTTYQATNNSALVANDFNDSSYKGFRLSARYDFNEDWQLLVQHAQQDLMADGVFDYDPEVGDLKVSRYFEDSLADDFTQTSWTLEGRLDALELLYTGSFLDRDIAQSIDYTGYNNAGAFIAYYTCTYTNPDYIVNYDISPTFITQVRECKDPTKGFMGKQQHQRNTHEVRFATDHSQQLSGIAGIFYDDIEIKTQDDYWYLSSPEIGFAPNAPISTAKSISNATRPAGVAFFNDITRAEQQTAVFGELSWKFSDRLTGTAGVRWYHIESDLAGSSNFADGIFQGSVNTDRGRDYDLSGGHSNKPLIIEGVVPKLGLSYQADSNQLYYVTYSEGFRPGGFNRGGGINSVNPDYPDVQTTYDTDDVINYEAGWKTLLLDREFRFNGSVYFIQWNDMQVSRFDPVNVSILTFIDNAADAQIKGIELDMMYRATGNLTFYGALSYNHTKLVGVNSQVIEIAPIGSELPLTPKFQTNFRTRYDWQMAEFDVNWQLGVQYAGQSYSSIVMQERERQDSYTTVNFSIGFGNDNWSVKLYADNLTDERATLFINNQDDTRRITTNRPTTIGLSFTYDYY
ncbi:MAG: TonB-dependent receptor [Psychrosphaera sp.]|nr:TonB-dependent receptor [Psychrosphaera sp.]